MTTAQTVFFQQPVTYVYTMQIKQPELAFSPENKLKRALQAVCTAFSLNPEILRTDKSRRREIVIGRQSVWKIVKEDYPFIKLRELAKFFGNFDHTTVIHGIGAITDSMLTDPGLKERFFFALKLYNESENMERNISNDNYIE